MSFNNPQGSPGFPYGGQPLPPQAPPVSFQPEYQPVGQPQPYGYLAQHLQPMPMQPNAGQLAPLDRRRSAVPVVLAAAVTAVALGAAGWAIFKPGPSENAQAGVNTTPSASSSAGVIAPSASPAPRTSEAAQPSAEPTRQAATRNPEPAPTKSKAAPKKKTAPTRDPDVRIFNAPFDIAPESEFVTYTPPSSGSKIKDPLYSIHGTKRTGVTITIDPNTTNNSGQPLMSADLQCLGSKLVRVEYNAAGLRDVASWKNASACADFILTKSDITSGRLPSTYSVFGI